MQVDLDGLVALVTGAAQGIGRSIADTLARNGARVVYTDRDPGAATEAAGRAPSVGDPHLSYALDVADGAVVDTTVARIAEATGRIDILVNNAGIGVKASDRK